MSYVRSARRLKHTDRERLNIYGEQTRAQDVRSDVYLVDFSLGCAKNPAGHVPVFGQVGARTFNARVSAAHRPGTIYLELLDSNDLAPRKIIRNPKDAEFYQLIVCGRRYSRYITFLGSFQGIKRVWINRRPIFYSHFRASSAGLNLIAYRTGLAWKLQSSWFFSSSCSRHCQRKKQHRGSGETECNSDTLSGPQFGPS